MVHYDCVPAKRRKGLQVQIGALGMVFILVERFARRRNDRLTFRSARRRGIDFIGCANVYRDCEGCENNSAASQGVYRGIPNLADAISFFFGTILLWNECFSFRDAIRDLEWYDEV